MERTGGAPAKERPLFVWDASFELMLYAFVESILENDKITKKNEVVETWGSDTGQKLIEILTREQSQSFKDDLEVMKFICTPVWKYMFNKGVDNLKTNNKGVYILSDNEFKLIGKIVQAGDSIVEKHLHRSRISLYLSYINGLVRGCLDNLGLSASVSAVFEANALSITCTLKDETAAAAGPTSM